MFRICSATAVKMVENFWGATHLHVALHKGSIVIPTSCSTIAARFFRARSFPAAVAALAVAGASPAAHALPTGNPFPGPTGLGAIPTTDTAAPGGLEASLNYEDVSIDDDGGQARLFPLANLTYGIGRGEIGAVYARERTENLGGTFKTDYFALHGKYRLYEAGNTAVAFGAHYYDFGSDGGFDLGTTTSLYLTASQAFTRGDRTVARIHGGLLGQRISGGSGNDSLTIGRPFAGLEFYASPEVSLAFDYMDSRGDVARASTFSVRFQPKEQKFGAQIGVGQLRDDFKFFVGATYRFGG